MNPSAKEVGSDCVTSQNCEVEGEQNSSSEDQAEKAEPDSTFIDTHTENRTPAFEDLKTDEKSCRLNNEKQKDENELPQSQMNISNTYKEFAEMDLQPVPEEKENGNSKDSDEEDTSFCKPCGFSFESAEKYYRHTRGILHIQRLVAQDLEKSGKSGQNSEDSSQQKDGPAIAQQTGSGCGRYGGDEMIERCGFSENFRCKLCDIKTTGLDPIIEHVNGRNHKLVLDAVKKGTPLPLRLQRKLGPNAEALKSCSKSHINAAQRSGPSLLAESLKNVPEAASVPTEAEKGNNEDLDEEDTSFCKICGFSFDCVEKYYRHTRGILHIQRLVVQNLENSGKSEQNSEDSSQQKDGLAVAQQTGQIQLDLKGSQPAFSSSTSRVEKGLLEATSRGFDDDADEIYAGGEMIVRGRFSEDYRCKLCDIKSTGLGPIIQHVNGKNHKLVLEAVTNGTPLPLRLQRKLGPNAEALKSCAKSHVNAPQGSGASFIKANITQQNHMPNTPKNKRTFGLMNYETVQKDWFKFQTPEGQGVPFVRHAQNMTSSQKGAGSYGNQMGVSPKSVIIQFPEFNRGTDFPVCMQRAQAILSLRLLLYEEFINRGVPPQGARANVETRLKLLEEYEKQGLPFDVARERVMHEDERWNLLIDFERQSLSFEEAESRIDRRFQLLDLYEKQGMRRADAAQKIIQEEVLRDFKAEFVKVGYGHTEAQELGERRLFLLDVYHKHGLSPEEARRRLIAEEQKWRSGTSIQLGSTETMQYPQTGWVSSTASCSVPGERELKGAPETDSSQKTEEVIANRISKLLQKLVPQNNRIAQVESGFHERDEMGRNDSGRLEPVHTRTMSQEEKEQLQEKFDRRCREEIQKLFTQLLEQQIPPDEARVRLQILKREHENKRQALFSKQGSQQEFWTKNKRPNSPEYREFFRSSCRNDSVGATSTRYHRSPSIESRSSSKSLKRRAQSDGGRCHRSPSMESRSSRSLERRTQRDSSRHHRSPSVENQSYSVSPERRLQRAPRTESRDREELTISVKKLYDLTKSLGYSDIFEQLVKSSVASTRRSKSPSSCTGPSHEHDHLHRHLKSPSPYPHKSSPSRYLKRNLKYLSSRSRSPSTHSLRTSGDRSPYLWQSSHSRTRSPLFTSEDSDEGHDDEPYLCHSRSKLSTIHLSRSRSKSSRSWGSKYRESSSSDRIRLWSRRNRYETAEGPEGTSGSRSRSSHSLRKNHRERSSSSDRMVVSQLQGVSPPSCTYSSHRRGRISPYERQASSLRESSSSHSRQLSRHSRDESGYSQRLHREGRRSPRPSYERRERERLSGHSERSVYSDEKAEFHFQNGVWYDSDLDHQSLSSSGSSLKDEPKSKKTSKRREDNSSPRSGARNSKQRKLSDSSESNVKNCVPSIDDKEKN